MRLELIALSIPLFVACSAPERKPVDEPAQPEDPIATITRDDPPMSEPVENDKVLLEQFADLRVLQYRVSGWDALPPKTRVLIYHLTEAALAGRDITWDQHHPQGLLVRKTLEAIDRTYKGDRSTAEYRAFDTYLKRVWFSNGIYHHYSNRKLDPGFSAETFARLVAESDPSAFPVAAGEAPAALAKRLSPLLFDPKVEPMRVSLDAKKDLIAQSANNFYQRGITQKQVEAFYKPLKAKGGDRPVMFGLNSKLVKNAKGKLEERVWKVGGMYGTALEKVVMHLEGALPFTENAQQRAWLEALIKFYRSGDLVDFDAFNVAWVKDTSSTVDLINGFIETYGDALDMRGTYESIVEVKDPEASRRIATISGEAQWFEDHMPYLPQHKKPNVKGISARVIDTVLGVGDSGPASPIGVNLPNSDWIRTVEGSKSVTLGNLMTANEEVKKASGVLEEFAANSDSLARLKKWASVADKLEVDMHEVIGHASGQLEPGVLTMTDTLKNYASCLEEARADLVALYYLPDAKLVALGLVPDPDVARAAYDAYITNGLLIQLARIPLGESIQEAHMRNRHMIAQWIVDTGGPDVVARVDKAPGKTAYVIKDFDKVRSLVGDLLKEIQRIKSQGDFKAGQALVETYGVKLDPTLHAQVKARWDALGVAPFTGFVNPKITPIEKDGQVVDAKLEYVDDFATQMRDYAAHYSNLPVEN